MHKNNKEKSPYYGVAEKVELKDRFSKVLKSKFAKKAMLVGLAAGSVGVGASFRGGSTEGPNGNPNVIESPAKESSSVDAYESTVESSETIESSEKLDDSSEYDYMIIPENMVEAWSFKDMSAEQQSKIRSYEYMSSTEFLELPYEEQSEFSYFMFENMRPRLDVVMEFEGNAKLDYHENANTAEEYMDNYNYKLAMVSKILTRTESENSTTVAKDTETMRKMKSLIYSETDNGHNNWDKTVEIFTTNMPVFDAKIEILGYMESKSGGDGNFMRMNVDERDNSAYAVGNESNLMQHTVVKDTFMNINGELVTIDKIADSRLSSDPMAKDNIPTTNR